MSEEKQRYYTAFLSRNGKRFLFSFRNDSMELARDHARVCADTMGMKVQHVGFVGTKEPKRLGEFVELIS